MTRRRLPSARPRVATRRGGRHGSEARLSIVRPGRWAPNRLDDRAGTCLNGAMLICPSSRLAFAHFAKTGGTSVARLIVQTYPDARWINPRDTHVSVGASLKRTESRTVPIRSWLRSLRGVKPLVCAIRVANPRSLRVLGVVRDPFAMAVSLFDHWNRKLPEGERHHSPLASAATLGDFPEFLRILSGDAGYFPTYREFFDEGGPLWANTHLIDFDHLEDGLAEAREKLGLALDPKALPHLNAGDPRRRQLAEREREAGDLATALRRRYAWPGMPRLLGAPA